MGSRSKTVHLINALEIGGVEVGVLSLIKSKLNHNYSVVAIKGGDDYLIKSLSNKERNNIYICNSYFEAFKVLRSINPDVVVCSLWRAHLLSCFFKLLSKHVFRIHFAHNARFAHIIDKFATILSVRTADIIYCDSEQTEIWLSKNTFTANADIKVVPMNVSFSDTVRKFSPHRLSFVYVGRFSKVKNLEKSFDLISCLLEKNINCTFDLYGRDDGVLHDLKRYVELKRLRKYITFHDGILPTDVESVIRNYNYYLQTSLVEGMAISVFQSIKNGLFPVVNPVGEISEYSKHRVNAFHLDIENLDSSVDSFVNLINDESADFSNVGQIINSEKYDSFDKVFFEELSQIYTGHQL